jgi:hypothetical protein
MFLMQRQNGHLVEVVDMESLYDPCRGKILAKSHAGEEMQDPEDFAKSEMVFPSGEPLPRCWLDSNYRLQAA